MKGFLGLGCRPLEGKKTMGAAIKHKENLKVE